MNHHHSCIQLVRKLPPSKLDKNILAISNLVFEDDELFNEFSQKVDHPAEVCKEDIQGEFLKCEFNRDGDSYRSPLSNHYFPPLEDGKVLAKELRELEVTFNKVFPIYAKHYYSNTAITSVYLTELGEKIEEGFLVTVLIKNDVESKKEVDKGIWDSINFMNVQFRNEGNKIKVTYKLTTTIILQMSFKHNVCGVVDLSGSITRQNEETCEIKSYLDQQAHIEKIGKMIEDLESILRAQIEEIYFKKSQEVIDTCRFSPVLGKPNIEQANKLKEVYMEGEKNKTDK